MRFRPIVVVAIILTLLFPAALFAANPKAGAKCSKVGITQIYAGKKFTCVKSGKYLIWNSGVIIPKPKITASPSNSHNTSTVEVKAGDQCVSSERGVVKTTSNGSLICKHDEISAYRWHVVENVQTPTKPSPTQSPSATMADWSQTFSTDSGYFNYFNGACQVEKNIEPQWAELQAAYFASRNCSGIYSVAKYKLGNLRPSIGTKVSSTLPTDQCKISESNASMTLRGFYSKWEASRITYTKKRHFPAPNMTIQVVPIYAEDTAEPINSPEKDYGKYLSFFKEWIEYSSDVEGQVKIKYPKQYLKFSGKVSSYNIYHENRHDSPGHVQFGRDLISQVDSEIDFTGVDAVFIVVPAGTKLNVFQQGTIGELVTKEGSVYVSTTEYPYTLSEINSVKFSNFLIPFWWIHEFFHSSIGFSDHYGDNLQNVNTEYGLGWWTMMTPFGGDLSAWEKWILGFYNDNQIYCLSPNTTNVTWLAPSSVDTSEKKLTIIPISEFKAIAIESIRPAGLYYKIPKESQGVLVYEIDLTKMHYDEGLKLVLPTNRNPNQGPFFLAQAPLRQGETVISNGQKITVVESGTFGDVVKIEKA